MEGLPGITQTVHTEGVLGQTEVHVVLSNSPPFTMIHRQGLPVGTETVQTLWEEGRGVGGGKGGGEGRTWLMCCELVHISNLLQPN